MEWLDPPMPGGCWTPQLVSMAGGQPVPGGSTAKTFARDWHEFGGLDAEILIMAPCGFKLDQTLTETDAFLGRREESRLAACAADRVFIADGAALFNRPGPRLVETLEFLLHAIHPQVAEHHNIPPPNELAIHYRR